MKTNKGAAIVLVLFVWSLAGALFGSLFAGLHQVLQVVGLEDWQSLIVGAAVAAMTTSAFYSAMPVALVGAMAGVVASVGYLMLIGHSVQLRIIVGVAGSAGLVAGAAYAWLGKGGMRPLALTLAGLFAGLSAGGLLVLGLKVFDAEISIFVLSAGVVALVGGLFQVTARWIVSTSSGWCPRTLSAPVVAGLIAAVVGASVWIMGGTTAAALDVTTKGAIAQVINQIPSGFFGGILGGAVTGVLLQLTGVRLGDSSGTS